MPLRLHHESAAQWRVLVAGGGANDITGRNSAELYDSQSGVWTNTGAILVSRESQASALFPPMVGRIARCPIEQLISYAQNALKSAVLERRGQQILFHPRLIELSAHYHFAPRPCQVRAGNQKGRVERAIRYVRDSFWAGRASPPWPGAYGLPRQRSTLPGSWACCRRPESATRVLQLFLRNVKRTVFEFHYLVEPPNWETEEKGVAREPEGKMEIPV
jgi:hypothetical protein